MLAGYHRDKIKATVGAKRKTGHWRTMHSTFRDIVLRKFRHCPRFERIVRRTSPIFRNFQTLLHVKKVCRFQARRRWKKTLGRQKSDCVYAFIYNGCTGVRFEGRQGAINEDKAERFLKGFFFNFLLSTRLNEFLQPFRAFVPPTCEARSSRAQ